MIITILVLLVTVVMFVIGKIRADIVALCSLTILILCGILSPAVTLGASMCFASPFSTPPNALVMQAGGYTFGDYIKVGLPLQIIMGIVMTIVLPLLFPF